MRVGLVIYGPLDHRSGGYLYDAKIVQHLREQGDEVRIFSLPPGRSYLQRLLANLDVRFWRELARAELDVLLQDELNHPSLVLGNRWLRGRVEYPIVSIVHHLYADEWPPGWEQRVVQGLERAFLAGVDACICNSQATQRRVRALGVACPSRVAYPGGDRLRTLASRKEIRQRAYTPGPLRALFLGNIIPRKQLGRVIRAVAALPDETCTLDVVGSLQVDPRYARQMQRLSEGLGAGEQVTFHGRLSDGALEAMLRDMHVLAVLSQHEGFGIVYLEAMGQGVAVIANQNTAINEYIKHQRNGFLLSGKENHLAILLKRLHDDRELLERISLRGRSTFEEHPTWSESGAAVRDFLKALI